MTAEPRPDAPAAQRLAEIFGEVLPTGEPESASGAEYVPDLVADGPGRAGEEELRRNVPPHHG